MSFTFYSRVIWKVILCFYPQSPLISAPIPLFQWYPQNNEILLNLGMKCWNSALNEQGSRLLIVVVQVGAVKIYVAAVRLSGKGKDRMKLSLPSKLVGKLVWVPVISFCKIFIPTYKFDALLCRYWPFLPLDSLTLRITLISDLFLGWRIFIKRNIP